jgi:hypothetical protein
MPMVQKMIQRTLAFFGVLSVTMLGLLGEDKASRKSLYMPVGRCMQTQVHTDMGHCTSGSSPLLGGP